MTVGSDMVSLEFGLLAGAAPAVTAHCIASSAFSGSVLFTIGDFSTA